MSNENAADTRHSYPSTGSESPTWPIVLAFAARMERKLDANRHKGDREGWLKDNAPALLRRLREETQELADAISREESLATIADEAADVANFAMMIADVCGELLPQNVEWRHAENE